MIVLITQYDNGAPLSHNPFDEMIGLYRKKEELMLGISMA